MSYFMSVIKNMISEDKEYKRITSEKLIKNIKEKTGNISQTSKEFIEKYGATAWDNISKGCNSVFPTQYYTYNIFTSIRYSEYRSMDQDYSDAISLFTFKEALERVYNLINDYVNAYPRRKFYIELSEKYDECKNDMYNPYEIILIEKVSKDTIITATYTINRSLVTILPNNNTFIVPDYEREDKVYEL